MAMSTSTQAVKQIASTEEIRAQFPALERQHNGYPVAYFDAPGGTQTPQVVVDAVADYLLNHNANTHWEYPTSHETDAIILSARQAFADFLNASDDEIAFGPNTTTMIYHLSRALGRTLGPGDEIVITELEHHANIAPWQALEIERGVRLNICQMDPETGQIDWNDFERLLTKKTKVVAFGAVITDARGTVLSRREREEGPGFAIANVTPGRSEPIADPPDRFWLHRRGAVAAAVWNYQRLHGRRWYRRHVSGRPAATPGEARIRAAA